MGVPAKSGGGQDPLLWLNLGFEFMFMLIGAAALAVFFGAIIVGVGVGLYYGGSYLLP